MKGAVYGLKRLSFGSQILNPSQSNQSPRPIVPTPLFTLSPGLPLNSGRAAGRGWAPHVCQGSVQPQLAAALPGRVSGVPGWNLRTATRWLTAAPGLLTRRKSVCCEEAGFHFETTVAVRRGESVKPVFMG